MTEQNRLKNPLIKKIESRSYFSGILFYSCFQFNNKDCEPLYQVKFMIYLKQEY